MAASAPSSPKTLSATGPVIIVILVLVAALLGYYQIAYYPANYTSSATSSGSAIAANPHNVTVTIPVGALSTGKPTSFYYQPDVITVFIGFNATVIWVNNDTVVHTVTAVGTPPDPRFSQFGPVTQFNNVYPAGGTQFPQSVNFTFITPGTYNYTCSYHPFMKGEVIVKAALGGAAPSQASS